MSDEIDLTSFKKIEHPGEWDVVIEFRGTVRDTIKADTREDAQRLVRAEIENGGYELYSNEAEDCRVESVRPSPALYLVLRDGRTLQSSRVMTGDQPRDFTEGGF